MNRPALQCRVCSSPSLRLLFKLARVPVSGYAVHSLDLAKSEPDFDLTLSMCCDCSLVQLEGNDFVQVLIDKVYSQYQSTYGLSPAVQDYMRNLIQRIHAKYHISQHDTVLEVGCNDGTNLDIIRRLPCNVLGVEPSQHLAKLCIDKDLPVLNEFFQEDTAIRIARDYGAIRVIMVRHVLEHIFDLREFVAGLRRCMGPDSILLVEVPYIASILQGFHFEGIAHPHLSYFSLRSLDRLLTQHGIRIASARSVPTDGGSILVEAQLHGGNGATTESVDQMLIIEKAMRIDHVEPYQILERRIRQRQQDVLNLLRAFRSARKRVFAFGAGKGHTILNVLGLDSALVEYVIDDAETKHNMFLPGCGIQVLPSSLLDHSPPDFLLMLAPTHAAELKSKISLRFPQRSFRFVDLIPQIAFEYDL